MGQVVDLKAEERRRQATVIALTAALFATTLPVMNERALFSPLGDVPLIGDLSPVAYAATFGRLPGGPFHRRPNGPALAYAARVPQTGGSTGQRSGASQASPQPLGGFTPDALGAPVAGGQAGPAQASGGGTPFGLPGFSTLPGRVVTTTPPGGGSGGTPPGGGSGGTPNPVGAVPEPASWALMILGFGVVGASMRRKRRQSIANGTWRRPGLTYDQVIGADRDRVHVSQHVLTHQ